MKSFTVTFVLVLLFFLALLFGAKNDQVVTISYFIAQGEFRLPVVLAFVFICGFIVSWLLVGFHLIRMKMQVRQLSKKLAEYQKQSSNSELEITP